MIRLSLPQKKGGVGKTTLAIILALWFSKNKRVLLVDLDDQCSLSSLFLEMDRIYSGAHKRPPLHPEYDSQDPDQSGWIGRSSSCDIFYPDREVWEYNIYEDDQTGGRLDILPGNSEQLIRVRDKLEPSAEPEIERVIKEFFSAESIEAEYDMVIFDTGPSDTAFMRGVVHASTHTIIPIEMEQQCIDGLDAIVGIVLHEQRHRSQSDPLDLTAMQVNKFRKNYSLHTGLLKQLSSNEVLRRYLSPVVLPSRVAFAERDVRGLLPRSVFELKPSDPVRQIATEWCEYIESKLFGEIDHGA